MNLYKKAFELLTDTIRKGDDVELLKAVNSIDKDLAELVEAEEVKKKVTPTAEQFSSMSYTDRNNLHTNHPEVYKEAIEAQRKGGI